MIEIDISTKDGLFTLKQMQLFFLLRVVAFQYSFVGPVSISKGCDLARPERNVKESALSESLGDISSSDIFSSSEFTEFSYEYRVIYFTLDDIYDHKKISAYCDANMKIN